MNIISFRKRGSLILALVLLLSMSLPVHADIAAASPQYPYGLKSVVDDQLQAQQMLISEWESWKDNFLSSSGRKRVITEGIYTVSEGMGYGLLLSVYFNEQTLFDELFDYVKVCSDSNGLMNWKTNNGIAVGPGSASDADQNIALALIFADKMWGSEGQVDYETEANDLLGKIKMYEFDNNGNLKPGDSFSEPRNPSYLVPGWYEVFRAFTGSEFWASARNQAYKLSALAANSTTGLVPDWCTFNGGQSYNSYDFRYDAIKLPLKMAIAYSWYGHTDAKNICSKQVNFFKNKGAANIVDGYKLNGTPIGNYHNPGFVACVAAMAMTGTDKQLAKAFYDECLATEDSYYYGSTLRLLSLMYMTGNLQNLYANGKQITGEAASSAAPTGTVQPGAIPGDVFTTPGIGVGNSTLAISSLPMAEILEGMGGTVEWNSSEQKATIRWNGTTVELWNGKKVISINGVKKEVETAPKITANSGTLLSKSGCSISWESDSTKLPEMQAIKKPAAVKGNQLALPKMNISSGKWDGLWYTDMGAMTLFQDGENVIGIYGEDDYFIEGTVSGNKLTCTYYDGENILLTEFSMAVDGLSFTGICGDDSTPKSSWSRWNGKR